MKHLTYILLCTALTTLAACSFFKGKQQPMQAVNHPMLDTASLFNIDSIRAFTFTAEADLYAKKLYLNAIDLLVNKKDAEGSLAVFIQSARICPDAYTYLKYGDALFETGNYKLAETAYWIARRLNEQLEPECFYGHARCEVMLGNHEAAIEWLWDAFATFPLDIEMINNEKAFDAIRDNEKFKILMAKNYGDENARKKRLLDLFAGNFNSFELPYSITPDSLNTSNGLSIDYRYADLVERLAEGQFSRDVMNDYQYVAQLPLSTNFKTFVYRMVNMVADTLNPVHLFVVNIDTGGNVLAEEEIACFCSPLTLKAATIMPDGFIEVKEILQTWKEDPIYKGYAGNEVVKQELKGTTYLKIDESGQISPVTEAPAVASAYKNAPEVVNVEVKTY